MINGLPERLKELRIKSGYSQRMIAKQLQLSPSIISGYETGDRTPSLEVLLALSYMFRCSTDYLLGRDAALPADSICVDGLSPRQIQAMRELVLSMQEANLCKYVNNRT